MTLTWVFARKCGLPKMILGIAAPLQQLRFQA